MKINHCTSGAWGEGRFNSWKWGAGWGSMGVGCVLFCPVHHRPGLPAIFSPCRRASSQYRGEMFIYKNDHGIKYQQATTTDLASINMLTFNMHTEVKPKSSNTEKNQKSQVTNGRQPPRPLKRRYAELDFLRALNSIWFVL